MLTTQTAHHAYFVRELSRVYPDTVAMVERRGVTAPFETHHPFEDERETLERERFFDGGPVPPVRDLMPAVEFDTVNDPGLPVALAALAPDVVIVFGTRIIRAHVLDAAPRGATLNLHGGDPERYRGLDSHLWSIYHGDRAGLVTVLHHVEASVDSGAVVGRAELRLPEGLPLAGLRAVNTEACLELVLDALGRFGRGASIEGVPQCRAGRYYSFMPSVLKEQCVRRFAAAGVTA